MGIPSIPLARLPRKSAMGYQPHVTQPRFADENGNPLPPGMTPQSYDPNRSTYVPQWGISAREATDALAHMVGGRPNGATLALVKVLEQEITTTTPQDVGCVGYEEL